VEPGVDRPEHSVLLVSGLPDLTLTSCDPFSFSPLLLANAPIARLCGRQERVREFAGEQARAGLG